MNIEAIKKPYEEEHMVKLKSLRLRCRPNEAKKIHKHYEEATQCIRMYWDMMSNKHLFDLQSHLESKLKFNPMKVKGQKMVASRRFQRHKSQVEIYGRYYTHEQILGMIENKLWGVRDKNKLEDYTDSMRLRFNAYLDWVAEWDQKFNEGFAKVELNDLKVEIIKPPIDQVA